MRVTQRTIIICCSAILGVGLSFPENWLANTFLPNDRCQAAICPETTTGLFRFLEEVGINPTDVVMHAGQLR
jgi:hypothetical protein